MRTALIPTEVYNPPPAPKDCDRNFPNYPPPAVDVDDYPIPVTRKPEPPITKTRNLELVEDSSVVDSDLWQHANEVNSCINILEGSTR